mgnify:CR=1 FL=1
MERLCRIQLNSILLKILSTNPRSHKRIFVLPPLYLKRIIGQHDRLAMVDNNAAHHRRPLHHLVLRLPENNLQWILIDRVLTHRGKHLKRPGKLLPVSEIVGPILLEVLVERIKHCLIVNNLIVTVVVAILNYNILTFSLIKSKNTVSSTTLDRFSAPAATRRVIRLYFSLKVSPYVLRIINKNYSTYCTSMKQNKCPKKLTIDNKLVLILLGSSPLKSTSYI